MTFEPGDDLVVDVLVIGAGLQGAYVARSLADRYRVCLLHDPAVPPETLDSLGWFSAGYDGNDVARMQPARRTAGFWRLWAESNEVPRFPGPVLCAVAPADEARRVRLWDDAALGHEPAELPAALVGGSLTGWGVHAITDDVVLHPADLLGTLREGLEEFVLPGRVARVGLAGAGIDHVFVEVGEHSVTVVPRYVVLAGGIGNAELLSATARRMPDQAVRRERLELARSSQAVREMLVVAVRGDLPLIAGHFGELDVAAQPAGDEVVWLVSGPVDDTRTVLGSVDTRFPPPLDTARLGETVQALRALAPVVGRAGLQWGCYTARRTQHPMLATPDTDAVGQPVPAKLEAMGLEGCLALWPSSLGYAMLLGDVVAERASEALGPPTGRSTPLPLAELGVTPEPLQARWDRPDFAWEGWDAFVGRHGLSA